MTDTMVEEYAVTPPLETKVEDYETVARRLGLGTIRHNRRSTPFPSVAFAAAAAKHYPEWTGRVLKAWRKFMPTRYLESAWPRYAYDKPPLRVLKAIEAAKSLDVFDRLEIWTPQFRARRRTPLLWLIQEALDPVCVGIVQGRTFPIVRWGDEELVSERKVRLSALLLRDPDHRPRYAGQSGITFV